MTTQDEFRLAWASAYWEARDSGLGRPAALQAADDATMDMLDDVEDGNGT